MTPAVQWKSAFALEPIVGLLYECTVLGKIPDENKYLPFEWDSAQSSSGRISPSSCLKPEY